MLTLSWTATHPGSDADCTVIAGRLPLRAHRDLAPGITWLRRTRRHLATAPGLVGHAAAVETREPALWIVSAWTNRADLVRFDHSDAHHAAKLALRPHLWPATFAVWTCRPTDVPVTWNDVRQRIAAASIPAISPV
jgi:hypothetical protein